jgi:tetratricopeptide (TPR) repeat protein
MMLSALLALTLAADPAADQRAALQRTVQVETQNLAGSPEDTEALYRLGLAYLALGEGKKAIKPLEALLKAESDSLDGKLLLSRAYRTSGEPEKAKALLDMAILSLPDESSLRSERGLLARQLGETDVAVEQFKKAVELAPTDPELRFNLGEALQTRGSSPDETIAAYRKALELKPDLAHAKVNLAKALAEKKQFGEAKELLQAAAREDVSDAEAHYNLAVILMREGNAAGAISEYERTLAINPQHAQAHNNLGVAYDARGERKKALEAFKKATVADPNYAEAFFNLGLSYFAANDNPRATKAFEQALKLEPSSAAPYTQLGTLYLKQGQKDRAVEAFKKAIDAANEQEKKGSKWGIVRRSLSGRRTTDAHRGLALAYLASGKADEAVNTLKDAVKVLPDDPSARRALAEAYVAQGKLDEAVAELQKRLELEPTTESRLDLAGVLVKKRQGKQAEALYRETLKAEPHNHQARVGLVDLYLEQGRLGEAEKMLEERVKEDPNDAQSLARYGILHSRMGRPDKALPALETATERDPSNLEARAELGFLYFRGGDIDKASRLLQDVLTADGRQPLALHYLGMVLYRKGQPKAAEQSFIAATRLDPSFAAPWFSLGELFEAEKKTDEAKKAFETASKLGHREAGDALKRLNAPPK